MKRLIALIALLGIGAAILNGCSIEKPVEAKRVNLLVTVEGKVQLKRDGWKAYVPVGFGTVVYPTDLLKVEGKASVLCADLSIKSLERGRCPCPTDRGWLEYQGARFSSRPRSAPSDVPYILYPRNTMVLESRPLLRWHVTGVTSYTVSIVRDGQVVWSQPNVIGDGIRYPDDAPSLQSGADYLLVVRDNATLRVSTEDPMKGLGFRSIDDANRRVVMQRRDAILALDTLEKPARQMALAVYYIGLNLEDERGLWSEAWQLLESVAQAQNAPAVYLRTGDVLLATKLSDEAKAAYQTALRNAESMDDMESQAAAHVGLWQVTGDTVYLDRAVALYDALGDKMAETLRKERQP